MKQLCSLQKRSSSICLFGPNCMQNVQFISSTYPFPTVNLYIYLVSI